MSQRVGPRGDRLGEAVAGSDDPVARVELYHFSFKLPATFRPAWIPGFPANHNRCTLIRVVTAGGLEGWSARPALGKERAGLGDLVGPYLIGEDATDIALVQQRLREMSYLGWRNWWIEPAFWDIKGWASRSTAAPCAGTPGSSSSWTASAGTPGGSSSWTARGGGICTAGSWSQGGP